MIFFKLIWTDFNKYVCLITRKEIDKMLEFSLEFGATFSHLYRMKENNLLYCIKAD